MAFTVHRLRWEKEKRRGGKRGEELKEREREVREGRKGKKKKESGGSLR